MESVTINRNELAHLIRVKEELDLIVESLELMSNPEVMEAHKRAKEQIKNRDFAGWNELQNNSN